MIKALHLKSTQIIDDSEANYVVCDKELDVSAIEVKNLSRSYGDIDAVKDVSFTVPENHLQFFLVLQDAVNQQFLKCCRDLKR